MSYEWGYSYDLHNHLPVISKNIQKLTDKDGGMYPYEAFPK